METSKAIELLMQILSEIRLSNGEAATERFPSLRSVDAKVTEAKRIFANVEDLPHGFAQDVELDNNFDANSRRVRLETLIAYIQSAVKFLQVGGTGKQKKKITRAPDVSMLTTSIPELKQVIEKRWLEAQKCQVAGCYTSAIIMMGSILEALLLARAQMSAATAYKSTRAPKQKDGKTPSLPNWNLNQLIEVATDVGWLKVDRGKFSHALRESRNVVHPWVEVTLRANFDNATCLTSWQVLKASINDLIESA